MERAAPSDADGILFAQHGWADTNRHMLRFGQAVAGPTARVVAPNLGYLRTWRRMDPLVDQVDAEASRLLVRCPAAPFRVVGHSLGGLIWLEVLGRHPEWWPRLAALVLIAAPVGGTRVGRYLDPLGLSIARDLQQSRRPLAERLATSVPTLAVAGDLVLGRDGTISVASTRFVHARLVVVRGVSHAGLLRSRIVRQLVRDFVQRPSPPRPG